MTWQIEYTSVFEDWWRRLNEAEQESVDAAIGLLEAEGPNLKFPYSSGIKGARHTHMRELRIQHRGSPYRVLYAFDPRRVAVLLLGGNKRSDRRWYRRAVAKADNLYDEHLQSLTKGS